MNLKEKIENWWNSYPFTYFVREEKGSWAFFRNIDRKILKWHPWAQNDYPLLGRLVPYSELKNKKVLEVGCGTGWAAEQLVRAGANVTAVDFADSAVDLARKRFELYHLQANILKADAENLPFPNNYFDYVLAWGVLMHTPDTQKAVREIYRVLKAGGRAGAMMYHKDSLHWRWHIWFGKGILQGRLLGYSEQELANRYTDGAEVGGNLLTKFFTKKELLELWNVFPAVNISIYDHPEVLNQFPHRFISLGRFLPYFLKQFIVRHWGLAVWIESRK